MYNEDEMAFLFDKRSFEKIGAWTVGKYLPSANTMFTLDLVRKTRVSLH